MDISSQKELLKEIVHRVIVNPEGTITRLELLPPFAYLHRITRRIGGTGSKVPLKTKTSKDAGLCSNEVSLGGPAEISVEHPFVPNTSIKQFLRAISFPQKARLARFAESP